MRRGAQGSGQVVLNLGDGVTSDTILDAITDETWRVCIPIDPRWRWRDAAFAIATELNLARIDYEKQTKNKVKQIGGHNGSAVIKLAMRVKVPPQYDEARRQRAIIGLECPASHADRNPIELKKIAMGAATGHGLGSRREASFPYLVYGMQCVWETGERYAYADDDVEAIELIIQRALHLSGVDTENQRTKDSMNEWEQIKREEKLEHEREEARQAAERKRAEREARRALNRKKHSAEQAAKEEARLASEQDADDPEKPWR